jgi:hypothetical protein
VLGSGTSESDVRDVIANGHDACERSAFPQGEVLRGQVPPCGPRGRVALAPDEPWTMPANAWGTPQYSLDPCPTVGPEGTRTATGLVAISLLPSGKLCRALW